MLIKWLGAFFQHGFVSVLALLVAVAAVWWVEPTTNGGIAFLLSIVFIVALAVLELVRKLARRLKPAAPVVTEPPVPTVDAPPASPTTIDVASAPDDETDRVNRSRRRPRARR
jgi:hypothetical protein